MEIFLISLAAILFEIAMTRVFSFKLYHYFTYFILGIAMLGIGTGGVFVAIFPRLSRTDPALQIPRLSLAAALCVPVSYCVVAWVQLNVATFTHEPFEFAKLVLVCSFLFAPFLLVGIAIATIFGSRSEDMNRLYFADLAGAGIGCAIAIPLFGWVTPPGGVLASGVLLGAASLLGHRVLSAGSRACAAALMFVLVGTLFVPDRIPQPIPDSLKTMSPQRLRDAEILFTGWSPVFRVDVVKFTNDLYTLHHDGNIGSSIHRWDGTPATTARFDSTTRKKPFAVLRPDPKVLIIGAAGGNEIMGSLHFGASTVTAVELNPVTVSLLTEHFVDFTGGVVNDPRVTLVNAEGRSYLEHTDEKYDLIWLVAPDSYAAMNAASSGAFVLTESYLYTVEMIETALEHLNPGGVICNQFGELFLHSQPSRTPRLVATAMQALRERGVEDPAAHVIVSHGRGFLPGSTVLVGRDPFTPSQIDAYRDVVAGLEKAGMWQPNDEGADNPVTHVASLEGEALEDWMDGYVFDVHPVRDDSPFFWHFTSFRTALFGGLEGQVAKRQFEIATGERILGFLLLFGMGFAAIFLALPIFALRGILGEMPCKGRTAVYFAALGLGFMFVEVCMIQKLTLFLGYPSHSLSVTLFSLLLASGLGSLLAGRYTANRNRAFTGLLLALALIVVLVEFAWTPLTGAFAGAPFAARVVVSVLMLLPIGLVLGAFMPMGIATVSHLSVHRTEYIAWAWAVNGFFSVMGSVLSTILSMSFGFSAVLAIAFGIYAIGVGALASLPVGPRPAVD
jgi:spermidine synthase